MATMSSLPSGAARQPSQYFDDPQASGTPRDPDFDPFATYGSVHPPPAAAGHTPVVKLLINSGAEIDLITPRDETALSVAEANGHEKVVELAQAVQ